VFLDAAQRQQLDTDPLVGRGSKPVDVRGEATPTRTYTDLLTGASMLGGIRTLTRGGMLGGAFGLAGMGPITMMDYAFKPAAWEAQTRADTRWLNNASINDDATPYSFRNKKASAPRPLAPPDPRVVADLTHIVKLAHIGAAYEAACAGAGELVPRGGAKLSGVVKISSPLEKRANLKAILRENAGMAPYSIPRQSIGSALGDAFKYRPEAVGGPGSLKRKGMKIGDLLKDLAVRKETVVNAAGVPIAQNTHVLPGMPGKLLRVPLALGGLLAIAKGADWWQDKTRRSTSDKRFDQTVNTLRRDDGFAQEFSMALDPAEEGNKIQVAREAFDILDTYAPSVTRDKRLTAQFMANLLRGEGGHLTGQQYLSQVKDAVDMQNRMDQKTDVFGGASALIGRLIDPTD
jgi:hypothetical protein